MTLTRELSALALEASPADAAAADYEAAKVLLLDALGCALAGWHADGCEAVVEQMRAWGGRPEAGVLFHGEHLPAPQAAFANSVMVHALDLDDIYPPGTLHISSIVVPAMLAAAASSRASGREALLALIVGVEVAARIEVAGRDHRRGLGFLPTSLAGSFGGVITAARLAGLDLPSCVNAMGINYAQLAGNRQALFDSTLTKRLQPAMAVRSALWSTALARRGLTGAPRALEGDAGYYRLYLDMPEPPAPGSLSAPAEAWQIRSVSYKRYPSCGACHPIQAATEQLIAQEKPDPGQIARVSLFGREPGGVVGRPFEIGANPQVDAQFSVAWAAAHTLLRGPATLMDYQSERVAADEEVIALAQAVTYTQTPNDLPPPPISSHVDQAAPWQGVIVELTDGRRLVGYESGANVFAPGNLSFDEAVEKFMQCATFAGICPSAHARRIVDAVRDLDRSEDAGVLLSKLDEPIATMTGGPAS